MNKIILFENKKIRRVWYDEQWYFSVVDVTRALTESVDAKDYWYRLKQRELDTSEIELSTFCRKLRLPATNGKYYETDCANFQNISI